MDKIIAFVTEPAVTLVWGLIGLGIFVWGALLVGDRPWRKSGRMSTVLMLIGTLIIMAVVAYNMTMFFTKG